MAKNDSISSGSDMFCYSSLGFSVSLFDSSISVFTCTFSINRLLFSPLAITAWLESRIFFADVSIRLGVRSRGCSFFCMFFILLLFDRVLRSSLISRSYRRLLSLTPRLSIILSTRSVLSIGCYSLSVWRRPLLIYSRCCVGRLFVICCGCPLIAERSKLTIVSRGWLANSGSKPP